MRGGPAGEMTGEGVAVFRPTWIGPVVVALAALVSAPAPVGASADDDKARARKLLDEGNAAFQAQRYSEALAAYEAAREAYDSPKIWFNIGEARRALGRPAMAFLAYEAFVDGMGPKAPANVLKVAKDRMSALEEKIGTITLGGLRPGDVVFVDESRRRVDRASVIAAAGARTVHVVRDGRRGPPMSVDVVAGEISQVDVSSLPELVARAPEASADITGTSPASEPPLFKRWYFWAAIGVAVIGGTVLATTLTRPRDFVPETELGVTNTGDWESL